MVFGLKKEKFNIKEQWPSLLLFLLLASEFIFIIYLNVFHISDTIDEDFSGMLTHTLEIAKHKKLLLDYWFYPTTGEFDTSLLLAVPLYLISGDIYLSFGIVNILNAVLVGYAFYRVLRLAGSGSRYILMAMCMALAAYDFGMLSYTNMLFFCGSQYVYKAVLPLLFISVIMSPNPSEDKMAMADHVLFYGLFFLSSFSSGIYVFLCGIIPVIVTCFVIGSCGDFLNKKKIALEVGISTVIALIGVILHSINNLEMHSFNSDLMKLRHDMPFSQALLEVVDTFVQVINPVAKELIDATSLIGMAGGMKWVMLVVVCFGFALLPRTFGFSFFSGKEKAASMRAVISSLCISVFIFNAFILLIMVSKSRYHLIGFFPLLVCAVVTLEDHLGRSRMLENCFMVILAVMYMSLLIANITYTAPRYFDHQGIETYYLDEDFASRIKECADKYDVPFVFFVNTIEDAEIMRLYDTERRYETYMGQTGEVCNYDSYITDLDKSGISDRNMIVVSDEGLRTLKSYITDYYEVVDHIGKYDIMISDYAPMDGGTFIFKEIKTIDLPVTPGYEYDGDIGITGYLFSASEGTVLKSPEIRSGIPFECTLNYNFEGDGEAVLGVFKGGRLVDKFDLDRDEKSVNFKCDRKADYSFEIQRRGEGVLTVMEIEFEGR